MFSDHSCVTLRWLMAVVVPFDRKSSALAFEVPGPVPMPPAGRLYSSSNGSEEVQVARSFVSCTSLSFSLSVSLSLTHKHTYSLCLCPSLPPSLPLSLSAWTRNGVGKAQKDNKVE
eukprot:scaffold328_cov248-Pinguiococcus_pyrenoidosus.AAC.5